MNKVNLRVGSLERGPVRRVLVTVAGGMLCLIGAILLVLPGPGLLIVLAGLVVLASEYPRVRGFIEPVRARAWRAARETVASRPRIVASAMCGLSLIGAGITWSLTPSLPFAGPGTGLSLIGSGIILLALLSYAHRSLRPVLSSSSPEHERCSAPH